MSIDEARALLETAEPLARARVLLLASRPARNYMMRRSELSRRTADVDCALAACRAGGHREDLAVALQAAVNDYDLYAALYKMDRTTLEDSNEFRAFCEAFYANRAVEEVLALL